MDLCLENYDNPQRDLVARIRAFILECDPAVKEAIKWQAPIFMYKGNIASFFPKAKKHVSLMFHTGASLPDPSGILDGDGATSRSLKVLDHDDLTEKTPAIHGLVRAWIEQRTA